MMLDGPKMAMDDEAQHNPCNKVEKCFIISRIKKKYILYEIMEESRDAFNINHMGD